MRHAALLSAPATLNERARVVTWPHVERSLVNYNPEVIILPFWASESFHHTASGTPVPWQESESCVYFVLVIRNDSHTTTYSAEKRWTSSPRRSTWVT